MGGYDCDYKVKRGKFGKKKRIVERPKEYKQGHKNPSRIKICIVKNDKAPANKRHIGDLYSLQQYKSDGFVRDVYYIPEKKDINKFKYNQNEKTSCKSCNSSSNSSTTEETTITTDSDCTKCKNKDVNEVEKIKSGTKCQNLEGKDNCYLNARGDSDEISIKKFNSNSKGIKCKLPCVNQGGVCKSFPMYCCNENQDKTCDDLVAGLYCKHNFEYYEEQIKKKMQTDKKENCYTCFDNKTLAEIGDNQIGELDNLSDCQCGEVCPEIRKHINMQNAEVYKFCTKVENWKPGKIKICCPICSAVDSPAIKQIKKRALIAKTGLQATILVAFWPLCMIPFMMEQCRLLLFCKSCKNFLGQYDKRKGCVTPPELLKEQIAKIIYKDHQEVFF